jgi:hypothetical protein
MVKFNVSTLESVMIGLVIVFAIITFFGTIANDLAGAIANVTNSDLQGVAIFGIVGLLIVLGLLIAVMKGVMGKR